MLIQFPKDGSLEAIDCFLQLVRPNYLVFPRIVPTEGWRPKFSKESNEFGLFWSPVSIKLDKGGLEKRGEAPS